MLFNIKKGILAGLVGAAVMGSNLPAVADEVTITAASCFTIGSPPSRPFEAMVKEINAKGKGVIQVDLVGGAPAIGSNFTLTKKMTRGIYDLVGCPEGYFGNIVEEAAVFHMAEMTYAELRENGGLGYLTDLLAKKNIHYLGRYHDYGPFYLWLSQKIEGADLTGLNIRTSPSYTALFTTLGATVQTTSMAEVYTYMENGTVQGFGWPALAWNPAWTPVTTHRLEPGFYSATLHALINKKSWEGLNDEQRAIINTIVMDYEVRAEFTSGAVQDKLAATFAKLADGGIEAITLEGDDKALWSNTARDAGWAEVLERSPEHGAKLRALWTK